MKRKEDIERAQEYLAFAGSLVQEWLTRISDVDNVQKMLLLVDKIYEHSVVNSGNIVFMGIGKNVPMLNKVSATLNSLSFPSRVLDAVDALHGDLGFLRSSDIIIAVSKSGTTTELINTLSYVHKNLKGGGLLSVGVSMCTSKDSVSFDSCTDISIVLPKITELDSESKVPTMSPIAFQMYFDIIAMMLARKASVTLKDFLRVHPYGDIGKNLSRYEEQDISKLITGY